MAWTVLGLKITISSQCWDFSCELPGPAYACLCKLNYVM